MDRAPAHPAVLATFGPQLARHAPALTAETLTLTVCLAGARHRAIVATPTTPGATTGVRVGPQL